MSKGSSYGNKQDLEKIKKLIDELTMLCGVNKIPLLVAFQDSPRTYQTITANEQHAMGPQLKMMKMLIRTGDLDSFLTEVIRDAKENGHRSIFLRAMGLADDH